MFTAVYFISYNCMHLHFIQLCCDLDLYDDLRPLWTAVGITCAKLMRLSNRNALKSLQRLETHVLADTDY